MVMNYTIKMTVFLVAQRLKSFSQISGRLKMTSRGGKGRGLTKRDENGQEGRV